MKRPVAFVARRLTVILVWAYTAAVLAGGLMVRFAGDRWWFATLLLFAPSWLWAAPLAVLVPGAFLVKRRLLWPLLASGIFSLTSLMELSVPWRLIVSDSQRALRVLTCNVKGQSTNADLLEGLLAAESPDVVVLQGCWSPFAIDWPPGWHVRQQGEFVIGSRWPLGETRSVYVQREGNRWPKAVLLDCVVKVREQDLHVVSVHLPSPSAALGAVLDRRTLLRPSGRFVLEENIAHRWRAAEVAHQYLTTLPGPVILAGDFNMPPQSSIYRRYWSGYCNAFSTAGCGFGYTEWPRTFKGIVGVRIDHILTGPHFRPIRCWMGPDVGSDHLPVLADLSRLPGEESEL